MPHHRGQHHGALQVARPLQARRLRPQPVPGSAASRFEVRPLFGGEGNPAAWPSERGLRIGCQRLNSRFITYRQALGLDEGLDFHSFRRSYVTPLIEAGWDPRFVQEQVGHDHPSTTAIYTCVSSDFRTRTLRRHLDGTIAAALNSQAGRQR
ncbi:tyrosine-type recombinase/integrase [Streptomyces sp. NPDC046161]|uniref:tyrosine-type recombinase/integrase n=1 Tax=Streptomyces sp. NPDC046161 TaxID=3155132 RepID=UPI0033F85255